MCLILESHGWIYISLEVQVFYFLSHNNIFICKHRPCDLEVWILPWQVGLQSSVLPLQIHFSII